jgi:hypothetical protein
MARATPSTQYREPRIGAVCLPRASTFARVLGIALVALNLIAQFSWSTLYPFWALIVIAINVIIYALVVHGGELKA